MFCFELTNPLPDKINTGPTEPRQPVPLLRLLANEFGKADEQPDGTITVRSGGLSVQAVAEINIREGLTAVYSCPTHLSWILMVWFVVAPWFGALLCLWILWRGSARERELLVRVRKVLKENREGVFA